MDFFNNIEIDAKLKKAINQGLAIGIAEVNKTGKSSVELLHKDMMIKSYKNGNTFKIPIDDIDFVTYSKGNFLEDDIIIIGVSGNQLTIESSGNNEKELRNFYNNLIKIRNNEKMGFNYIDDNNKIKSSHQSSENISSILEKRINTKNSNENRIIKSEKSHKIVTTDDFDPAKEIRKYYELMKDGIISEEEFKEKKSELLNYKYS